MSRVLFNKGLTKDTDRFKEEFKEFHAYLADCFAHQKDCQETFYQYMADQMSQLVMKFIRIVTLNEDGPMVWDTKQFLSDAVCSEACDFFQYQYRKI
jgi:hypothetical protein